MKINKGFGDKVYIEWIDALSEDEWIKSDKVYKVPDEVFCYTNGFFVHQDKNYIFVTLTIGKTNKNDIGGRLLIPKKCIIKVR